MLGDQALTLVALPCDEEVAAPATVAVLNGKTVSAMPVSAPHTDSNDLRRDRRPAAVLPFAEDIVVLSALVVVLSGVG